MYLINITQVSLWESFMKVSERQKLYSSLEQLPERIVWSRFRKYEVISDDLTQEGKMALWEAIPRYDATQGASLETYAGIRIRGALIDYIRANPPYAAARVSRGVMRKHREASEQFNQAEQVAQRGLLPNEREIIERENRKEKKQCFWRRKQAPY